VKLSSHSKLCVFCYALLLQLQAALGPNWHSKAQDMIASYSHLEQPASGSQGRTGYCQPAGRCGYSSCGYSTAEFNSLCKCIHTGGCRLSCCSRPISCQMSTSRSTKQWCPSTAAAVQPSHSCRGSWRSNRQLLLLLSASCVCSWRMQLPGMMGYWSSCSVPTTTLLSCTAAVLSLRKSCTTSCSRQLIPTSHPKHQQAKQQPWQQQ